MFFDQIGCPFQAIAQKRIFFFFLFITADEYFIITGKE